MKKFFFELFIKFFQPEIDFIKSSLIDYRVFLHFRTNQLDSMLLQTNKKIAAGQTHLIGLKEALEKAVTSKSGDIQ